MAYAKKNIFDGTFNTDQDFQARIGKLPYKSKPTSGGGGRSRNGAGSAIRTKTVGPIKRPPEKARAQYCVVKFRKGFSPAANVQHLFYTQRETATKELVKPDIYGNQTTEEMLKKIANEKNQTRLIISPNSQNVDMKAFVTRVMSRIQDAKIENRKQDGFDPPKLLWIGSTHTNTDQIHAHVIVRGVDSHGGNVEFNYEEVTKRVREISMTVLTEMLGPMAQDFAAKKNRQKALGWIQEDKAILQAVGPEGILRQSAIMALPIEQQELIRARLHVYMKLGLAKHEPGQYVVNPKTGHLLKNQRKIDNYLDVAKRVRFAGQLDLEKWDQKNSPPILGMITDKGYINEINNNHYVLLETIEGKAYYVSLSKQYPDIKVGDFAKVAVKSNLKKDGFSSTNLTSVDLDIVVKEIQTLKKSSGITIKGAGAEALRMHKEKDGIDR